MKLDRIKPLDETKSDYIVVCQECGCVFNIVIARDKQHDYNKRKQELKCPACKEIIGE